MKTRKNGLRKFEARFLLLRGNFDSLQSSTASFPTFQNPASSFYLFWQTLFENLSKFKTSDIRWPSLTLFKGRLKVDSAYEYSCGHISGHKVRYVSYYYCFCYCRCCRRYFVVQNPITVFHTVPLAECIIHTLWGETESDEDCVYFFRNIWIRTLLMLKAQSRIGRLLCR